MIVKHLISSPSSFEFYLKLREFLRTEKLVTFLDALRLKTLTPSTPKRIVIDSSSICNLSCPFCPTGTGTLRLKKVFLKPKDFRFYITKFPNLKKISLFNWGEPFLNPEIFKILNIAQKNNLYSSIDTHFSLKFDDNYLKKIIHSGLDFLRVSLDGASPKTYSVYRKNGSFALAFKNMKRLRELQKKEASPLPNICWKFLVHKYNQHEINKAKKMAREIDVRLKFDCLRFGEDLPDVAAIPDKTLQELKQSWLPSKKKYLFPYYYNKNSQPPYFNKRCPWLFESLVVHGDGTVLPCCFVANKSSSMGNLKHQSLKEIWYSDKYQYARSLFIKGKKVKRTPVICERCLVYKPKE